MLFNLIARQSDFVHAIFLPHTKEALIVCIYFDHMRAQTSHSNICGVIYITIYLHTFFTYIIYHGNKAVCISWIDAKKLAHNSCKPVQDFYVNNNINLARNKPKIMEKASSSPKKYICPKSCSNCSCRLSCKN